MPLSRPIVILIVVLLVLVVGLGALGSSNREVPQTRVEANVLDGAMAR